MRRDGNVDYNNSDYLSLSVGFFLMFNNCLESDRQIISAFSTVKYLFSYLRGYDFGASNYCQNLVLLKSGRL